MAPKQRPAAAQSRFPSKVSAEVKANPVFQPGTPAFDLQACHLIPVKEKDSWIPKMVLAFGANKQFWGKRHSTKLNAIGLTQSPHKAMDAESGVKLAFLPDLQQSDAKAEKKSSREFLVLYHKYGASQLGVDSLFAKTAVEGITEEKGFSPQSSAEGCVCWLGRKSRRSFSTLEVSSRRRRRIWSRRIFKRSSMSKRSSESRRWRRSRAIFSTGKQAKGKAKKAIAEKAESRITGGKSLCIMYHFADDLQFYTVRGLQARALRLLGHKDFIGLKNGKHFTGDGFSDEESTEEDRSAPDEDAQKDLLMRACRDSVALSKLPVQHLHEPPKKKRRC